MSVFRCWTTLPVIGLCFGTAFFSAQTGDPIGPAFALMGMALTWLVEWRA